MQDDFIPGQRWLSDAEADLAGAELARLEPLVEAAHISEERLDQAKAVKRGTRAALRSAHGYGPWPLRGPPGSILGPPGIPVGEWHARRGAPGE